MDRNSEPIELAPNVAAVQQKMAARSNKAKGKYGVDTTRRDYGEVDWLRELEEELMDFSRTVQECIHYTEKNGLNYTITADLEDLESFIKITRKQTERFCEVVRW